MFTLARKVADSYLVCSLLVCAVGIVTCLSNTTVRTLSYDQVHVSELLEELLEPTAYNSKMRPGADYGKPLLVNVSLYVSDIYQISENGMEYSVTFYLRQRWLDERLSFNMTSYNRSITLNYNQFDKVWTPDVFIRNLKSGYQHQVTVPNRLVRIFPDGTMLFSQSVKGREALPSVKARRRSTVADLGAVDQVIQNARRRKSTSDPDEIGRRPSLSSIIGIVTLRKMNMGKNQHSRRDSQPSKPKLDLSEIKPEEMPETARLSVTLSCDMYLERYPMDNQTCHINFGSYAYTTSDIILLWDIEGSGGEPVSMNPRITFPKFILKDVTISSCHVSYVTTGAYPCLEAYFHLDRRLRSYIFYVYLPSLLIVILSWLSFWIDLQAVPARISLGILTILTMATQNTTLNNDMPTMSITKAMDVWMFVCMVFVFAAFLEYSVVNVLDRRGRKQLAQEGLCRGQTHKNKIGFCPANSGHRCDQAARISQIRPTQFNSVGSIQLQAGVEWRPSKRSRVYQQRSENAEPDGSSDIRETCCSSCCCCCCCLFRTSSLADRGAANTLCSCCSPGANNAAHFVDKVCRIVFPSLFFSFNIAYWVAYN